MIAGAQSQGRAHGTVSDPAGQPLADVEIQVLDPERSHQVTADDETNKRGAYAVVVIDATRPYIFRVSKEGYQPIEQEIKLPIGGNETYDWTLAPATAARPQPAPPAGTGEQAPSPPAEGEIQMSAEAAEAYNAGVLAIQAGDKATAKPKFEEAVAIDPNIAPAWAVLAALSLEEGDFAKAVEQADKALAIEPQSSLALEAKYKAHAQLGQTEEAAAARKSFLDASPEAGAQALLDEGTNAFNAGNMDAAIAALEQALAANPDLYKAHYTLGIAYANKEDNANAIEHLKTFLEAAPADDPDVPLAQEMLEYVEGQQ
ncbi:MAG: tetratricopeptide repeat protein [Thermoanaerobaculia bacterium]